MEEATRITTRDRRAGEALSIIPAPALASTSWQQLPREPHLLDYLVILKKHQWLILTFLATVVTVVTIASFKMKPVYVATARMEVDRESPNVLPFQDTNGYDAYMDVENYMETQTKLMQSETLALQTIKSLDLSRYAEFGGTPVAVLVAHGDLQKRPAILGDFLGRLSVRRVPNSRLMEVSFEAEDPQLAARVVNAHMQNFIEQNFRSRYDATTQASNWLSSELEELRIKVQKSEDARLAYERANRIETIDEKQSVTTQKLADLSKALTDLQTQVVQEQALYEMAHSGEVDSLPAVRESPVIQDLTKKESDLDQNYTEAVNQYGPNFPKVQRLQAQRKELEDAIAHEKLAVVNSLDAEYRATREKEQLLQKTIDAQKTEDNELAEKLIEYRVLEHDADANKQLYDGLLQKLKEATLTAGLRSSDIRIVDPALVPSGPSRPQRMRNIFLAFLIGLVGGVGLAFFREYLDNTVKTPDDIESLSGLPSLAVVPILPAEQSLGHPLRSLPEGAGAEGSAGHAEVVSLSQPKSQMSEAFRALRTSLLLSQAEHPPQVILVTSALPREGKTTSAVNLGVTLAQLGDRTILVDCDLRKPSVRRCLGMEGGRDIGLSSYLAGVTSLEEATLQHPVISNLAVLPTGPIPPNPADLLSSQRMRDAIALLRNKYKFVVIDSPPAMAATDPVILSALTDGVLLIVRSGGTPKEAFTRTRDLLAGVKSRILGVVLNAVDPTSPDYYYSYRYYPYSYGYGESQPPEKKSRFPFGSE